MDGFTGFQSAAIEELPDGWAGMATFDVVHLAGNAHDEYRCHTGQDLHHRHGRATDPPNKARRILQTRSRLLIPHQQHQLLDPFTSEEHIALEITWRVYQHIPDAYRTPDTSMSKAHIRAKSIH